MEEIGKCIGSPENAGPDIDGPNCITSLLDKL